MDVENKDKNDDFFSKFSRVSIQEATQPRSGLFKVMCNDWWIVTSNNEILLYKGYSPQCNSNKDIVKSMCERMYPTCSVQQIPVVYLKINPSDYV